MKKPTYPLYLIQIVIFLMIMPTLVFAEKNKTSKNNIPLPSGLSKDTQFIIYYLDKRFEMMEREMDKRFAMIEREMDKRFEQVDRRFEQVERRFEQVDKRFEQIDKRFEQVDKRFEQVDKRFEQVDKRFEQVDKRFEELNKRFEMIIYLMMSIVTAFAAIVAVAIGFAIWDRRTMIRPFEDKVKKIEADIAKDKDKLLKLIKALRKLAQNDPKVADVLKTFSLL